MKNVQPGDLDCIEFQLGRTPRDVHAIGFRCACSKPAVVQTPPRLGDGTPFPTFYYATCPRLTGAISTLESSGLMAEMNERLAHDPDLAAAYHYTTQIDSTGRNYRFSKYDGGIGGGYSEGTFGGMGFGVDNLLEMKLKDKK